MDKYNTIFKHLKRSKFFKQIIFLIYSRYRYSVFFLNSTFHTSKNFANYEAKGLIRDQKNLLPQNSVELVTTNNNKTNAWTFGLFEVPPQCCSALLEWAWPTVYTSTSCGTAHQSSSFSGQLSSEFVNILIFFFTNNGVDPHLLYCGSGSWIHISLSADPDLGSKNQA